MNDVVLRTALIIAFVFLFGACLGDSADRPASRTRAVTPDPAFAGAAEQAARDAVLLLQDAPAGWTSEPDEPSTPADERPRLSEACTFEDPSGEGLPGRLAFHNGDALFPVDRQGPEVNSEANVFADAETARETFEHYSSILRDCRGELAAAFETQEANDPRGGTAAGYRITDIDPAPRGENTIGVRISWTLPSGASVVLDFVTVRRGRVVSTLAVGGVGPYDEERERYLSILEEKAERADASLP